MVRFFLTCKPLFQLRLQPADTVRSDPIWTWEEPIFRPAIYRSRRYIRRGGKVWIRIFPSKSVTKKAAETRQGGGKGAPDHWVAVVKAGRILFEMGGVSEEAAKGAMRLASYKLPIDTRFVVREPGG